MALERRAGSHGRRRGAPLWAHLTALVLIPITGVVVMTAIIAQARVAEASSAARAEEAVRAMARLNTARSGVDQEIIPVLSLAVVDDPSASRTLGIPAAFQQLGRQQADTGIRQARATTDRALAALAGNSVGAAAATRVKAEIAALRKKVDARRIVVDDIYLDYLDVSNELMNAQQSAAAEASSEGVPGATRRAIQDVQIVAELTQSASRPLPLFMGSLFPTSDNLIGARTAWQTAWLDYTDAQRQMAGLSQASLRQAWAKARTSPAVADVDKLMAPPADGGAAPSLSLPQMITLMGQEGTREATLAGLVNTAVGNAQALVTADHEEARHRLWLTMEVAIGLLLISLVGAVALGRAVARSLGLLAGQAQQISEGNLVEVESGGPREVRTVSRALGAAVAGLRRIQDQAQAVARGDLTDALLDQPLPGPLGEVVHASIKEIVSSVRQREELQFALAHQATHDPLTGLPNRAQALTLVTSALHRARRSGSMTGLLFCDLDGFKAVNDRHGHACGDEVLREVGRRLRNSVRPGDVVCRLGGDEFVVLVEPVASERDLLDLAERLIAAVSEPIEAYGERLRIGASVGVSIGRDGSVDADVLFAEADTAAYRAKEHGRGRAEIFDDTLRLQLAARAELEAAISAALTNGEMRVHYQPVVDVASGRIAGYEALVRWQRPGLGMVPPDEFIPVAETSRLILDLDRWVLHEATRQLAEWRMAPATGPDDPEPTMAVNISGRHLSDPQVIADVVDALVASGLPAPLLILEVTETVLLDDPTAFAHLDELRRLGVGIAIDDFGTGYTSIGQLRNMPVDTLKIDRSFIASPDPGHRELVALIIRAAHTFGLTVVAEGVEEPVQLDRLREQSCDQAQGYLMYRPLPAADAGELLRPAPAS